MSQQISHSDNFNFKDERVFDNLINKAKSLGKTQLPMGWVQIFLNNEMVHEGPNLIVSQGREFVAQKIFNTNKKSDGTLTDFRNHNISHFAIGSGGATMSGQSFTLTGPVIGDTMLSQPISLGTSDEYLTEPNPASSPSGENPIVHTSAKAVKPIMTHGDVYLEPVSYDGGSTSYTKVLATCHIPSNEPSMLEASAAVLINEAGLYFVNPNLPDSSVEKVKMFAHICFAPKFKEVESDFTIYWYILC